MASLAGRLMGYGVGSMKWGSRAYALAVLWALSVPGCIGYTDEFDPDPSSLPGSAGAAAEQGGGGASGDSGSEPDSSCDAADLVYVEFVVDRTAPMAGPARGAESMTLWEATVLGIERALGQLDPDTFGQVMFPGSANRECESTAGVISSSSDNPNLDDLRQSGREAAPDPDSDVSRSTRLAWYTGYTYVWEAMEDPQSKYHRARGYVVLVTNGMPGTSKNCFLEDHRATSAEQFDGFIDEVSESDFGIRTLVIGLPGSEDEQHIPRNAAGDGPEYDPREMLSRLASAGETAREGCSADGPRYCHADLVDEPDTAAAMEAVLVREIGQVGCAL